ncbi:MAG: flippase-like domain-containing protein [Candidatus Aminicenantes bacterium]|nr:flippase-like domain-containing protein [Candidatus Aminicenantes bacterium]
MKRKTWIQLGLVLVLTAVFLYFFLRGIDWGDVWTYLRRVDPAWFLAAVLLAPVHLATRGLRWRYLLVHEKADVRFYNLFAANAVGFTVTFLLPGRIGEIVKPLYLARRERCRAGFAIGTIVVERIFDMMTMCSLLGLFLLARPLYAAVFKIEAQTEKNLVFWGFVGAALALSLLVLSLLFYFFKEKALRAAAAVLKPVPHRIRDVLLNLLHEFIDGLKIFHSLGNLFIYAGLSFAVWLGITFFYWVAFQAFGLGVSFFLLIPYIFLTMVGASIPTPGMVGGFHYFSKLGLVELYGVDPNLASGATLVVHAVQLVVTCLIGYAILWKDGLSLLQLKRLRETMSP